MPQKIAEHVLEILVNLSGDPEILENLATDEKFLDVILLHITACRSVPGVILSWNDG